MSIFDLFLYSAMAWYIAYTITSTHGPLQVFDKMREWRGGRWHGRSVKLMPIPDGPTIQKDGLLDCVVCLILWVAFAICAYQHLPILWGFGIAGVGLWLHSFTGWRVNY